MKVLNNNEINIVTGALDFNININGEWGDGEGTTNIFFENSKNPLTIKHKIESSKSSRSHCCLEHRSFIEDN